MKYGMSTFSAHRGMEYPPVAAMTTVRERKSPHSLAREVMPRLTESQIVVAFDRTMED